MLDKISKLFFQYGIKSLSMDDISTHLGISKKTLYLSAKNKQDLVIKVLESQLNKSETEAEKCNTNKENAIKNMITMAQIMLENTKGLKSQTVFELKKYYPQAFELIENHEKNCIAKNILQNLQAGIKQGMYRKNIDIQIVTTIYLQINNIIFLDYEQNTEVAKLFKEIIQYHLNAIITPLGKEYMETNKILQQLEL